jgi:hypothetical protein
MDPGRLPPLFKICLFRSYLDLCNISIRGKEKNLVEACKIKQLHTLRIAVKHAVLEQVHPFKHSVLICI